MHLTDEEKYKIYLEEKERLRLLEEDKLKSIPNEEKQKIFKEFENKKVVFVNMKDVVYPLTTIKQISWVWVIGFAFVYFFISIIGSFIWAIGFPIAMFMLESIMALTYTELRYTCPHCNHVHQNILRDFEQEEMESTGYINAKCYKCSGKFNLIVEKDVFNKVTVL